MPALLYSEMPLSVTGIAESDLPGLTDECNREISWRPTPERLRFIQALIKAADIVGTLVLWAPLKENHFEMAITGATQTSLRLTRIK